MYDIKLTNYTPERTPLMGYYDEENPAVCIGKLNGQWSMV